MTIQRSRAGTYEAYYPEIRVGMTDKATALLRWLHQEYGGTLNKNVKPKWKRERWRPYSTWRIGGAAAESFLLKILPYSMLKAPQIRLALELIRETRESPKRTSGDTAWTPAMRAKGAKLKALINDLNRRGPLPPPGPQAIAVLAEGCWRSPQLTLEGLLRDIGRETSWPRPKASDAEKGSPNQATRTGPALPGAVCQEEIPWARPRASAAEDRTTKRTPSQAAGHGEYLGVQVQEEEPETSWPRLTVSDGLGGHCPADKQPTKRQGSQPQKEVLGARLNPAWEEALLGWPIGLVSGLPWPEYGREVAERKRAARHSTSGSRPDSPPE